MSFKVSASIVGWSFAPTELLRDEPVASHIAPLSPDGVNLDFIPPALRRRCSNFSKVTLAVAHAAMNGAPSGCRPHTVFASLHGESVITRDLLRELAVQQQLSPMGFSLSVHNAASGLYSIASGNTAPSSAIAAGEDTFFMGLAEALLSVTHSGAEAALFVCSDDVVPSDFLRPGACQESPYAFAILLAGVTTPNTTSFSVAQSIADSPDEGAEFGVSHSARVARWMLGGERTLSVVSKGNRWNLSVSGGVAADLFKSAYR